MHTFWQRLISIRYAFAHAFLATDAFSEGDSGFSVLSPDGVLLSMFASASARSFPVIPVWLGIHASVVRVPLDFRLLIVSLMRDIASFVDCWFDTIVFMAELESQYTKISGGLSVRSNMMRRVWYIACNSAENMLECFDSVQDLATLRRGM